MCQQCADVISANLNLFVDFSVSPLFLLQPFDLLRHSCGRGGRSLVVCQSALQLNGPQLKSKSVCINFAGYSWWALCQRWWLRQQSASIMQSLICTRLELSTDKQSSARALLETVHFLWSSLHRQTSNYWQHRQSRQSSSNIHTESFVSQGCMLIIWLYIK